MTVWEGPWFRRLWLANGILLFIFLLLAGTLIIASLLEYRDLRPDKAVVEIPDSEKVQPSRGQRAVRYEGPSEIEGTRTKLVRIRYGSEFTSPDMYGVTGGVRTQPLVNVAFLDSTGVRLLFDRPAFIRRIDYPTAPRDSLQRWISDEVALEDEDNDGQIGSDDPLSLYVTDLNGFGLGRVLSEGYDLAWHGTYEDGRSILVYALELPSGGTGESEEQLRQRAFLYDIAGDSLAPFHDLNATVDRAGSLLSR